ncbi:MAG: nucleosidase [Pseudomonadota bacterium]
MIQLSPLDVLVVFALKSEAGGCFDDLAPPVLYTGVGKINATYALTRHLGSSRPKLVVSFGTAGSPRFATHSIVECTCFVQRDMDARGLGFAHGTTPLDRMQPVLRTPRRFPDLLEGRCGSGDSFVQGHEILDCNVVDMEAYALAKVCVLEGVDFLSIKYITDGGDQDADKDWAHNLPKAAAAFRALFDVLTVGKD